VATFDVHFQGGPCNGRQRRLTFLYAPAVLHCGGDRYTNPILRPNGDYYYSWDALKPVPLPSEVVGARDVLRGFRHWMQALARGTTRQVHASARARARIRRAVR
jgi:hypothetical protein